jgi:NAD(P)-dependent dehydrogenase (short-subunit alcohol dehydrogenase family)
VLVNSVAHQMSFNSLEEIRSSIINTSTVNLDTPARSFSPTPPGKGAIQNFTGGLAQLLAARGIRPTRLRPIRRRVATDQVRCSRAPEGGAFDPATSTY